MGGVKYLLCNTTRYAGHLLRPAKEIDDLLYDVQAIQDGGGILVALPNPALELRAEQVRRRQVRGGGLADETETLSSAYSDQALGLTTPVVASSGGVPVHVGRNEIFTVPRYQQMLFATPIDCEGFIQLDGLLLEVR